MKVRLIRPLLNFAASVAMVSGGLLLIEAAITLAWQEPLAPIASVGAAMVLGAALWVARGERTPSMPAA